eukprot:9637885-Karenia_brevis.AAC.1
MARNGPRTRKKSCESSQFADMNQKEVVRKSLIGFIGKSVSSPELVVRKSRQSERDACQSQCC